MFNARTLIVVSCLSALAGCFASQTLRPGELVRLDGFGELPPSPGNGPALGRWSVEDMDGEPVRFTSDSQLVLRFDDNRTERNGYQWIHVRDGQFEGMRSSGTVLRVPLDRIREAEVSTTTPKKTTVSVVLVLLSLASAVGIGAAFASLARLGPIPAGGCGSPFGPRCGRPLRVDGELVASVPAPSGTWILQEGMAPCLEGLSDEARRWLAEAWLADATHEHAGVAAFSRLSLVLMAARAPDDLVEAVNVAAVQEIDHARRLFSLASSYAGRPMGPGLLPALLTTPPSSEGTTVGQALVGLAEETLVDGCLNEGLVAALTADALARTVDPAVRAALEVIARDEASHADLAWRLLGWLLESGCREVRARASIALRRLPGYPAVPELPAHLADNLRAHGRIDTRQAAARFASVRREVVNRASQMLLRQEFAER